MEDTAAVLNSEKEYRALARSFRFYKLVALALCLMFIVGGLVVFRDEITVENFRYLIRYLDMGSSTLDSSEALLQFDAGEASGSKAQIYKNDLVLINRNHLEIFDFRNGKIFNDTFSMTRPTVSVSSAHTMVYDLAGKRLRLYNSFSMLQEYLFDYPIFCADTDDSGRYAVATSEKNYHCAVYVYNASHTRVFRWLSADKYVCDLALGNGTDRLAIATVKAEQGDFVSELHVFSSRDSEYEAHFRFAGEMPLKVDTDGKYARLLTDRALHTVNLESGEIIRVPFDRERIHRYHFGGDASLVVLDDDTVGVRQELLICSPKGELLRTEVITERILDVDHFGEYLYFLTEDKVIRLHAATGEKQEYPVDDRYSQFCAVGEETAVLVANSYAKLTTLKTQSQQISPEGEQ